MTMAKHHDRIGIFSVPTSFDQQLIAEVTAVHEAIFEQPLDRWYELRHELFEHLIRVAATHRVVTSEAADDALVDFVIAVGPNKTWDAATPEQRRDLARKHLDKIRDPELRAAISEVIADPGDFGLWIETEAELPGASEPTVDVDVDVDVEEVARKLDAYVAEQDRKVLRRDR
jgi:hypothetical protein